MENSSIFVVGSIIPVYTPPQEDPYVECRVVACIDYPTQYRAWVVFVDTTGTRYMGVAAINAFTGDAHLIESWPFETLFSSPMIAPVEANYGSLPIPTHDACAGLNGNHRPSEIVDTSHHGTFSLSGNLGVYNALREKGGTEFKSMYQTWVSWRRTALLLANDMPGEKTNAWIQAELRKIEN